MEQLRLTVWHAVGLHARPAAEFVSTAARFAARVRVRNATKGSAWADAKSILSVLVLGVACGHEIELEIEGPDEAEAAQALRQVIGTSAAPAAAPQASP